MPNLRGVLQLPEVHIGVSRNLHRGVLDDVREKSAATPTFIYHTHQCKASMPASRCALLRIEHVQKYADTEPAFVRIL